MDQLFSEEWMQGFMMQWNVEPGLCGVLEMIGFSGAIDFGFANEVVPGGRITVENGKAEAYQGEALSRDVRCREAQWKKWINKPPGMMGLGVAFTSGQIKFKVGDYASMLKDPRMAGPFIKSFVIMGQV